MTAAILIAAVVAATSGVDRAASKPRQVEHAANKVVVKSQEKAGRWRTEREYPLMFLNNPKAKKKSSDKEGNPTAKGK